MGGIARVDRCQYQLPVKIVNMVDSHSADFYAGFSRNLGTRVISTLVLCRFSSYRPGIRENIPDTGSTFFSSQEATRALTSLLPSQQNFSFIDLGCGHGGLLNKLAEGRPDGNFHGIEAALLPCLLGKFQATISTSDKTIQWGDFWQHNLSSYDVVYAYLSPVPMQTLWKKACREMRPGSILISNSFVIPGVRPDKIVELSDFTGSALYLWQIRKDTE